MIEHLELVEQGEIQNLGICVPPGTSKSLTVATLFPAWLWVRRPSTKIIGASYVQTLTEKNARLHRDLVLSEWHRARWPHVQIDKASAKLVRRFETSAGGFRLSTSVKGMATGEHGDYLILDDPSKAQDAEGKAAIDPAAIRAANKFWFGTMRTRNTNIKTTRRIVIMQRLHHEDTAGQCKERGYTMLELPMEYDPRSRCVVTVDLHDKPLGDPDRRVVGQHRFEDPRSEEGELLNPERYPREEVDTLKKDLGPVAAAAQLQQQPTPLGGLVFQGSWWWDPDTKEQRNRWTLKSLPRRMRKILVVDCSFKDADGADWVVVQTWGTKGGKYYMLDQRRGRWTVLQTAANILEIKESTRFLYSVYIEDKANGHATEQILRGKITGLQMWSPGRSSKEERAQAIAGLIESGDTQYPPDELAPWLSYYVTEHTRFPFYQNDDTVDGTSMALLILHGGNRKLRRGYDALRKAKLGLASLGAWVAGLLS